MMPLPGLRHVSMKKLKSSSREVGVKGVGPSFQKAILYNRFLLSASAILSQIQKPHPIQPTADLTAVC